MLQLAGTAVDAISVAGLETNIQLPGFDLCFDLGVCPPSAVSRRTVLFTHAHIDHMGALVSHCATRSLYSQPPPRYFYPEENDAAVRDLLSVWRRLDHSELECSLHPVAPGQGHVLGKGLRLETFRAIHRVPCIGYGLYKTRSRLRPAWQGAPGEELRAAKAQGVEIAEEVEALEVVFCGDTVIDVVEREEMVRTARLLILECTFIDGTVSPAGARKLGHVHLDEIIERADLFENEAILLTHLSARYNYRAAQEVLRRRLPPRLLDRVTLLSHHRFGARAG